MATTILSWISSDLYLTKLHDIIGANKTAKNSDLIVLLSSWVAAFRGGQGLATGVLNLSIIVPQVHGMLCLGEEISLLLPWLGSSPWQLVLLLAVLKLPKLPNSYKSTGFHGFG
ncbi:hypothetical protein ACP70R_018462 [Stipagrostis hirtigluma subsp. patula]